MSGTATLLSKYGNTDSDKEIFCISTPRNTGAYPSLLCKKHGCWENS